MDSSSLSITKYNKILAQNRLPDNVDELARFFIQPLSEISAIEAAAFLMGLRQIELAGNLDFPAQILSSLHKQFTTTHSTSKAIDLCGTGGDGLATLNISTAASLLLAAHGVPVAKHGGRASSSKSGSADLLEALGVANLSDDGNWRFLLASQYHPAMRHVASLRKTLSFPTIFNYLGPLINPLNPQYQLIGTSSVSASEIMAKIASNNCWLVHSQDGMDEISPFAPSDIIEIKNHKIERRFTINYTNIISHEWQFTDLIGGDAHYNASAIMQLADGLDSAYRCAVLLNASAGLVIYRGTNENQLLDSFAELSQTIDNGRLKQFIHQLQYGI